MGRVLWGWAVRHKGRHRRRLRGGMIRDNTALRSTRGHKTITTLRVLDHPGSHVTSGGGAASLLSVAGRIAWKDTRLCEAFSCPWTSPAPSDPRRAMERGVWQRDNALIRAGRVVLTLQCAQPDPVQSPPCAESTGPRSQSYQCILRGHILCAPARIASWYSCGKPTPGSAVATAI